MKRFILSAIAVLGSLFCAVPVSATVPLGYVQVTGSHLQDSTGLPLVNGTISFTPASSNGSAISYQVNGNGQAITTPVTAIVSNGFFTIQLADTALTHPTNICFDITVTNNISGKSILGNGYSCFQPSGSGTAVSSGLCSAATGSVGGSCNFDLYVPNEASIAIIQTGPQGPQGTSGTNCASGGSPGTCTYNGTLVATVALQAPNISKGAVLYASGSCAVNSNILTGGGTDDSVCIQGLLTALSNAGGGTLIQDGPSLISAANVPGGSTGQTTALQIGSNTTIECTNNGGYYLANSSNVTMLGNNISGNPVSSTWQTNIGVNNCIFNENGTNQSRYELGNSSNGWVFGMWFGGFDTLTLSRVSIYNARTFAFVLGNGQTVFGDHLAAVQLAGEGGGGNNHDGLHLFGTLKVVNIRNFIDGFGDDDALAFNTDEGVFSYNAGTAWRFARYPNSGGDLDDITLDDIFVNGTNDVLRWIGYTTAGGLTTVSNITIKNVHGTVNNFQSTLSNVTANGGITIEGWNVSNSGGGGNTLYIPASASPLWLSNINESATLSVGTGAGGSQFFATGPATFDDNLTETQITNSQVVAFTPEASAGTSPTIGCYGGFICSANYGIVGLIVGSSPAANNNVFEISWGTAFSHPAICHFDVYDNTSGTIISSVIENFGAETTGHGMAYTTTALTASHSLAITYHCF